MMGLVRGDVSEEGHAVINSIKNDGCTHPWERGEEGTGNGQRSNSQILSRIPKAIFFMSSVGW